MDWDHAWPQETKWAFKKGKVHISAGKCKGTEGGSTEEHESDVSLRGGPTSMTYAGVLELGTQTDKKTCRIR